MRNEIGTIVWNKVTKQKFEIIYLNAVNVSNNSIILLSKGEDLQFVEFVNPTGLEANFVDINPEPQWPPKLNQIVWTIDTTGEVSFMEHSFELDLTRIYPTKEKAENDRDKTKLLIELQEYANKVNKNWKHSSCDEYGSFVIYKKDDTGYGAVCSSLYQLSYQVYFENIPHAQAAIEHFGDRLELLFK